MDKRILVVIPARGGSKGIPSKNVRLMCGRPLISYAIKNAIGLSKKYIVDTVVDTDSEEIADISLDEGIDVVMRPTELGGDNITLDPVVHHAMCKMEARKGYRYDIIITMQPTSPTLKSQTIINALDYFVKHECDTLISGKNSPHLSWKYEKGKTVPNYEKRVNRQQLPPYLMETGGFLITKREFITENNRLGQKTEVYEVPEEESIDIDTELDWKACETVLSAKRILLRADGEEQLGMGHIYRTISLAHHLIGHKILFVTKKSCELGVNKIIDSNFDYSLIENEEDIFKIIADFKPNIVVNDILNVPYSHMEKLKERVDRIVNFEDNGEGAKLADGVINALYESVGEKNVYSGFRYFFIRDEFITANPKAFSEEVRNIVVLFGGSDPSNLTQKTYDVLQKISENHPQIEFHIITGFGYKYKNAIIDDSRHQIFVHNDVKRVSKFLQKADLVITSQGRTIFEVASMGVPAVVIAQNEREMAHSFAGFENGFINLGLGRALDSENLLSTIEWLIKASNVRRQMHDLMVQKDYIGGQNRVIRLILGDADEEYI